MFGPTGFKHLQQHYEVLHAGVALQALLFDVERCFFQRLVRLVWELQAQASERILVI
jgi:hypothetical protein